MISQGPITVAPGQAVKRQTMAPLAKNRLSGACPKNPLDLTASRPKMEMVAFMPPSDGNG